MAYHLGPKALRIAEALRERILSGELVPGTKLPAHDELAIRFGVAPMTIRQALAHLEGEGLVSREQGRGTIVRAPSLPSVLIVDDEARARPLLHFHVAQAGFRVLEADGPPAGLALLEADSTIALVISDIRMPSTADGIGFIRTVRRRWPNVPLAAVTGFSDDLVELYGTPECPFLILGKPIQANQVRAVLGLIPRRASPAEQAGLPVLIADDDPDTRSMLGLMIEEFGHEVEAVGTGQDAIQALWRRPFGHVFLDLVMPSGGFETVDRIVQSFPNTAVVLATGYPERAIQRRQGLVMVLPKPYSVEGVAAALRVRIAGPAYSPAAPST